MPTTLLPTDPAAPEHLSHEVIHSIETFANLAEVWNALVEQSAIHVPFLRHEYLFAWWRTLGGGEWRSGELYLVLAWRSRELVGIAPFFITSGENNKPVLMLLGSHEISDCLDFIVGLKDHSQFMHGLLNFLACEKNPVWQAIDLYNLRDDSPTLAYLLKHASQFGFIARQEILQPAPVLDLPDDWEAYLAGIDKKQRHEIRRKLRRIEGEDLPVRWYIAADEQKLADEIQAFMGLMAQDPTKQNFLTPKMQEQFHSSLTAAFQAGWLQLAFLEVGGQKVAGSLNFDYDGCIWVYNSGLESSFGGLSPGWVLLAYLIQWAIETGHKCFDFMRGAETYKYRFGAHDRFVNRLTLTRG